MCGHRLSLTGSTAKNGQRVANYFCRIHHAGTGDCPEPAVASTRTLDPFVEGLLLEALADPKSTLVQAHEVGVRITETAERVKQAEKELDSFLATELASVLGPERYRKEVERRQEDVRAAMREFDEAMRANLILGQQKSRTPKQLVKDWPTLKIDAKRAVIRAYVERVTVGKADPKRRRWQPIDERVDVRWVGQPG